MGAVLAGFEGWRRGCSAVRQDLPKALILHEKCALKLRKLRVVDEIFPGCRSAFQEAAKVAASWRSRRLVCELSRGRKNGVFRSFRRSFAFVTRLASLAGIEERSR